MRPRTPVFTIECDVKFGGPSHYSPFEEQKVHPGDLKVSVTSEINRLLEPIRKAFEADVDRGVGVPSGWRRSRRRKRLVIVTPGGMETRSLLCCVCRRRCTHRRLGRGRTRNALRLTATFHRSRGQPGRLLWMARCPPRTAVDDASSESTAIVDGAP